MKKVFLSILLALLIIPCSFGFVGCGNNKDVRGMMSVSVNPAMTFSLDKNDKVIGVSYDDPDAGNIYVNVNFEGMTVDEAINTFVKIAVATGHVAFNEENKFTITANKAIAKDVEVLNDKIENQIKATCEELEVNTSCIIKTSEEALQDLAEKVKEIAPEYSAEEIAKMVEENDVKQLINILSDFQKDFSGLCYTQINDVLDNFKSNDGLQKAYLKAINTARTAFNDVSELMEKYDSIIPDDIKQKYNDAKAKLQTKIDEFKAKLTAEIQDAKKDVNNVKNEIKEVVNSEIESFKNGEFKNLKPGQQEKINAILKAYFPETIK